MHRCVECSRLTSIYTSLTLKFRIALTEAAGRVSVDDLDDLRNSSLEARRILQQHQLSHSPVRQQETTTPAGAYSEDGVILWPLGNEEYDTTLKPFRASAQTNFFRDQ